MAHLKDVLTTGDVARICKVAPRTVSKWFDTGQLRGYRIPGSRDRRIPLQQLIRFMKAHDIPLEGIETGLTRLLVVDPDPELGRSIAQALGSTGFYEVRNADSAFEAGALTTQFRPNILLVSVDVPGLDGRSLARYIATHPESAGTQTIAMAAHLSEADRQNLLQQGFDNTLNKPFDGAQLRHALEATTQALMLGG